MGGYIPFPNVPNVPGVPAVPRLPGQSSSALSIALGATGAVLARAILQSNEWGIFDKYGFQLGKKTTSSRIIDTVLDVSGLGAVLSTLSFDFVKETKISDFPIEKGSFASYNKVESPAGPVITFSLSGSKDDRTNFLTELDAACKSTELYNVVTPEVTYLDYSLERYVYRRAATSGATLLIVDVFLKEVRQISAVFTQSQTSVIVAPKNPGSTPPVDNGKVQAATPDTSLLKSIAKKIGF